MNFRKHNAILAVITRDPYLMNTLVLPRHVNKDYVMPMAQNLGSLVRFLKLQLKKRYLTNAF